MTQSTKKIFQKISPHAKQSTNTPVDISLQNISESTSEQKSSMSKFISDCMECVTKKDAWDYTPFS